MTRPIENTSCANRNAATFTTFAAKVRARAGRVLRVDRTAAAASAWAPAPSHGFRRCRISCGRLSRRRRPHANCPPPCGRQTVKSCACKPEQSQLRSAGTFGRANGADGLSKKRALRALTRRSMPGYPPRARPRPGSVSVGCRSVRIVRPASDSRAGCGEDSKTCR